MPTGKDPAPERKMYKHVSRHRRCIPRGRAALAVKASALALLLFAGIGWTIIDRAVTLIVDGSQKRIHTRAATVGDLLSANDHRVGKHDEISPSLDTTLSDGLDIRLDRARRLTLTVDGVTKQHWVTSRTLGDALNEVEAPQGDVKVSRRPGTRIPLRGLAVSVGTHKSVTLVVGKEPRTVETFAASIDELLGENDLTTDADDRIEPARDQPLLDGSTIVVRFVTVRAATETVTAPAPEEKIEDAALMVDQQVVADEGAEGTADVKVEYHEADGEVLERRVVSTAVTAAPRPRKLTVGTKEYPVDDTGLNWAALAQCESGGRAGVVSANGMYHGLYQFSVQTWQGIGGLGLPSQATPREQTYRAILLYKRSGAGQWPECGGRLFG